MKNASQTGSAIFIVILAVAMFAALSYAVFRDKTGSMATMTEQQAKLAAEEIIAFGDALTKTIQALKLRDCSETQMDFANSIWLLSNGGYVHPAGHNTNAPASGCGVFNAAEGRLTAIKIPLNYIDTTLAVPNGRPDYGYSSVLKLPLPGAGDGTKEDMVWYVPNVKKEVCMNINKLLGVNNLEGEAPNGGISGLSDEYDGDFQDTNSFTDTNGYFTGKSAFCVKHGNEYSYLKTLLAR